MKGVGPLNELISELADEYHRRKKATAGFHDLWNSFNLFVRLPAHDL